ncbi:hypothetical protein [Acidianus brierleyi]|uniref:Archaeal Type IV pilin N-terminal domain-containing protein n=1 Tax=Acidianus brierleyi TaxID=41673 RepID=A0A2U9IFQ9_9CREN|nr:hypothetical protein [Acidianus brierleyi]AWR94878.1 hypothetical protein DFR85_09985 [Acidianus brierleyi]
MESISSFIIVIATVVVGIAVLSLFSAYAGVEFSQATILKEAQYYSEGLHVELGEGNPIPVVIEDYNYNGTLLITDFVVSPSLLNSASVVTPSMGEEVGNSYTEVTVYTTQGNIIYQGSIPIQDYKQGSVYFAKPDSIIWIMVNIQGNYYRIGYEVVK